MHIMDFDLMRRTSEAVDQLGAILAGRTPSTKDFNMTFLLHNILSPFPID